MITTVLTLHQGDQHAEFVEHPTEVAVIASPRADHPDSFSRRPRRGVMTTATLNEMQCVYVRQLLFEELHGVCEELARNAHDASDGSDAGGEDAMGTFTQRIVVVAELLNTVGWATTGDHARMVDLERKRTA